MNRFIIQAMLCAPRAARLRSSFTRLAFSSSIIILLSLVTAQACGPSFFPDVFVLKMRPDKPNEFAAGSLGILLPTYPRQDLVVAFRYLNGAALTPAEQAAYEPSYSMGDPAWEKQWESKNPGAAHQLTPEEKWEKAREKYTTPSDAVEPNRNLHIQGPDAGYFGADYLNCTPDAFHTAALTLESRAKTWGPQSSDVANWIKGQDAVFSNCHAGNLVMPADAPASSSPLLSADRAYQKAAASFYAAKFEDARAAFAAIGNDPGSPWRGIARFLTARCVVREAFFADKAAGAPGDSEAIAAYDPKLMRQAADQLNSLLKENLPGISHHAIQSELDFVRIRIEPDARLRELSAALSGPSPDPYYGQHLTDLTWYLDTKLDALAVREDFQGDFNTEQTTKDFSKPYLDLAKLRSTSTLVDWLITFQSPATAAKDHAIAEWQKTHTAYWLLAAITKATAQDAATPDLIAAAAELHPNAPAAESFIYHRIRLLIATGKTAEARALLDQALPLVRKSGRDSSLNLYLGLKAHASASLADFLSNAPRKVISPTSESQASLNECLDVMKNPKRVYDCAPKVEPVQFSDDAAAFFNTQAPLSILIESANSSALPQQLSQSIAEIAWVRAVLLHDDASAAKLEPLLPPKLVQESAPRSGFHPLMTLLRNPGLRPYLDPGIQRSYSYDFVESYRDNWWSADWQGSDYSSTAAPRRPQPVSFLTSAQSAQAQKELDQLLKLGPADTCLGQLALEYDNAHPDDPDVAESLYLVLRMIRYSSDSYGYSDSPQRKAYTTQVDNIRNSAARLLRQGYVSSPWTKKAAPFVGGS
jgi:hypothetical protein